MPARGKEAGYHRCDNHSETIMKKIILETLVLAALAAGQAHAAPIYLDQAVITATYNGRADAVLGLDHGFQAEAGSNTSGLDPTGSGVEFITADALFAFDFSSDGLLTVYNNDMPAPDGDYTLTFDFGGSLAAPVTSFTLLDGSMVSGVPGLSVLDSHTIALDLSRLAWSDYFTTISAQIGTLDGTAEVPEPASAALLLLGACGLAAGRRKRSANA